MKPSTPLFPLVVPRQQKPTSASAKAAMVAGEGGSVKRESKSRIRCSFIRQGREESVSRKPMERGQEGPRVSAITCNVWQVTQTHAIEFYSSKQGSPLGTEYTPFSRTRALRGARHCGVQSDKLSCRHPWRPETISRYAVEEKKRRCGMPIKFGQDKNSTGELSQQPPPYRDNLLAHFSGPTYDKSIVPPCFKSCYRGHEEEERSSRFSGR